MTVAHEIHVAGPQKVLVMHDWMSTLRSYDDARPYVDTEKFSYAFMDHRGYGGSRWINGENTVREASQDVIDLANRLGWDRFDLLAKKKVDRISLSGVPVASALGRKRMLEILAEAEKRTGLPCDTDLEAHIAALKHFGATQIALATRWPEAVNNLLTRYLADAGIKVLACRSRGRSLDQNKYSIASDDHDLALELGRQVLQETPGAQALLMPGGLWFAIHAVPMIEAEFGKPVLLNILSTTWAALHAAGNKVLHRPDAKWGKVLGSL